MENVADALKMAGAALIFIIAFTIAMTMFTRAKQTTDSVLSNLQLENFFPKVQALGENETREVGIETIIPTLYRYCQSDDNIQIRILDENDNELQIFDQEIESLIQSGLNVQNTSENYAYYNKLKTKYANRNTKTYMFGAPWANQNKQYYLERINAYIYGTQAKHMPDVNYSGEGTTGARGNYLMKYKDRNFKESYLEYRTSGHVYTDDFGEEIVVIPASMKIVITYKLI